MTFCATVGIAPVPWQRTGGKGGKRWTKPETRSFQNALAALIRYKVDGAKDGLAFFPLFPIGPLRVDLQAGPTRGDRDNVEKSIFDALNGILWKDDRQIVDGRTRIWRKGDARITITVKEADDGE